MLASGSQNQAGGDKADRRAGRAPQVEGYREEEEGVRAGASGPEGGERTEPESAGPGRRGPPEDRGHAQAEEGDGGQCCGDDREVREEAGLRHAEVQGRAGGGKPRNHISHREQVRGGAAGGEDGGEKEAAGEKAARHA